MSDNQSLVIQTHVMGIPVSIIAKNDEERLSGSMYLSFFVIAIFLPVAILLQYQYYVLAPILFTNPIIFPSFMFYIFAWVLSSVLGTGTLFLLFFGQLSILSLYFF